MKKKNKEEKEERIVTIFNIHFGQARLVGGAMRHIPKSPKSQIIMQDWENGVAGLTIGFKADRLGNIEVTHPKNVETMVGLGYPIYDGDGKMCPVPMDDLLYPTLQLESEYWKRINQATGKSMKGV